MEQYIKKSEIVEEIEERINKEIQSCATDSILGYSQGCIDSMRNVLSLINTLEVKEGLTWEDIRELYIIFAEVDTEIEFCKCDIQAETIGYYQEVLKRFKTQKGGGTNL